VVIGIFEVISDMEHLEDDPEWGEIMIFRIKPVETPPEGYYLDFASVVHDKMTSLDLFPNKKLWASYLQGKTCRPLSQKDFDFMRRCLSNPKYLKQISEVKPPAEERRRQVRRGEQLETAHDTLLDRLITIGEVFGFETSRKPSVNDLRPPDQPFKAREKALDIAWRIAGLTWVPFEVQVHGSIPDLIYRLNLVHQWSLRMVIVADDSFHEEIREAAQVYPFAGKLVLLTPQEVQEATKDLDRLKSLRQKIFG